VNNIIETENIGRNFILGEYSIIRRNVTIGDDTEIRENCVIGSLPMAYSDEGTPNQKRLIPAGNIIIGNNVFINSHCDVVMAVKDSTIIEDDVILGQRVIVGHDSHIHRNVNIMNSATLNGHVTIKERTYIGSMANIRNRVTIGEHTVIGMGSNVTKDIPDNVIAYGNPCVVQSSNTLATKVVRKLVKEVKKRRLI
jgi:UDP-N-acetylglucosamine acyltransferase